MDFRYEKTWNSSEFEDTTNRAFRQIYNLGFRGFVWDYRFMSVNSYLRYSDDNTLTNGDDTKTNTDNLEYGFSSTLLTHPRFKFPITFFASQTRTESVGSAQPSTTTETNIDGINWVLRFVKLPQTVVHWEEGNRIIDGERRRKINNFSLKMEKSMTIGSTTYRFNFNRGNNTGTVPGLDTEVDFKSFNGTAYTKFSNTTFLQQGVNYFTIDSTSSKGTSYENTLKSYTATLTTNPITDLTNTLSYSYSTSKDESSNESTNHAVTANATYVVNPRLTVSGSLGYAKNTFLSTEDPTKNSSHNASLSARFRLTQRTSTSGSIFYAKRDTLKTDDTTGDTVKETREDKGITAGISHSRPLKWFAVGAAYNIGFHDISGNASEIESGYQLSHDLSLTATSLGWRYLNLIGSYEFTDKTGTIPSAEETTHRFRIDASSEYFRNTLIQSTVDKYIRDAYPDVRTDTTSFFVRARHRRVVWRGLLTTYVGYSRAYSFDELTSTRKNIGLNYSRRITFNISMSLSLNLSDSTTSTEDQKKLDFISQFGYRLRAWLISLEYDYRFTDRNFKTSGGGDSQLTENRIYIRLTRSFGFGV